jgi:hypothetical protein
MGVPEQFVVVQLQPLSAPQACSVLLALHGVMLPVQAVVDHEQPRSAPHVVELEKVEHETPAPLQVVPPSAEYWQPAARQRAWLPLW